MEAAISIAVHALGDVKDKGGQPTILHCLRVMLAGESEEERIVGVLHDVLEDTRLDKALLRAEIETERKYHDCGPAITIAVEALTRRDGESYLEYIDRVGTNPLARRVKIHDLYDNLSPDRLIKLSPITAKDLSRRYLRALAVLKASPAGRTDSP